MSHQDDPNLKSIYGDAGFGTSGLMGSAITNSGRIKLLESVFDSGVTHFDTAPLYGMGHAENVLGSFAKNKRDQITIASKYGLLPPRVPLYLQPLVPIARQLSRRSHALRQISSRILKRHQATGDETPKNNRGSGLTDQVSPPVFNTENINKSLHQSLNKLNTPYLDLFLMHDCAADQITDELIDCLTSLVHQGKICRFGFSIFRQELVRVQNKLRDIDCVMQFQHDIRSDTLAQKETSRAITYGALLSVLPSIMLHLESEAINERWRSDLSLDCLGTDEVVGYLLHGALQSSNGACMLFSSRDSLRARQTLNVLRSVPSDPARLTRFKYLVLNEVKF